MPLRSLTAALAALLGLACADVAAAAGITLGPGRHPDVAIDENNVAHVVWDSVDQGANDRLNYCQVPRGGKSCTKTQALIPPLEAIGQSTHVFAPGGGRIVIASVRCCGDVEGTHVSESTDGGTTFGPFRNIGDYERPTEAILGPGESISASTPGTFQNSPLAGPKATAFADLDVGFTIPTYGALGLFDGTTPVFVHADGDDATFHVWNGAGALNDAASWTGPTKLAHGGEVAMESNVAGVALFQEHNAKDVWTVRKFDGAGFTPENTITEKGDPIFGTIGGTPFNGGSFHAAWIDNRTPNRLRWARSPNGFNWSESLAAFTGDEADNAFNLRVAGARDGRAFVVWDQNDNDGNAKGLELPPKGGGPPIDAVRVAQYELQYAVPFPCAPADSKLGMSIKVKGTGARPKSKSVNVTGVRFTLDKKNVVNDTKPSFKASFPTAGLAPGSAHSLRAFVNYRPLTGGKTKVATLKATGLICP